MSCADKFVVLLAAREHAEAHIDIYRVAEYRLLLSDIKYDCNLRTGFVRSPYCQISR